MNNVTITLLVHRQECDLDLGEVIHGLGGLDGGMSSSTGFFRR